MSFSGILFKHKMTLVTLAIVGFISGYSWIQFRPEAWTFEVELVPVSPAKIDELTRNVIIDHFNLSPKTYVTEEKTDSERVDSLFRKFKYLLTSQSQRKKFLSEMPIDEGMCAAEAIDSIEIFQLDTQVPLFPSYRISATATCPAVSNYLNGFVETLKKGIFSEIVRTELARIRDASIIDYADKRQVLEQLKGLSGEFAYKDRMTLRSSENVAESFLEYEYTASRMVVIAEIDEKVRQLNESLEELLAKDEGAIKASSVKWDTNWIIESSAVFSSSKNTSLRLSLLYGFGLSSLLVMGLTILLTIKEEFTQSTKA